MYQAIHDEGWARPEDVETRLVGGGGGGALQDILAVGGAGEGRDYGDQGFRRRGDRGKAQLVEVEEPHTQHNCTQVFM